MQFPCVFTLTADRMGKRCFRIMGKTCFRIIVLSRRWGSSRRRDYWTQGLPSSPDRIKFL